MGLKGFKGIKRIYFIGIGGISMSSLAKFMSMHGFEVSGSDQVKSEVINNLPLYGIKTYLNAFEGEKSLFDSDMVVYTDAIPSDNIELTNAIKMKKKICSRADLLHLIENQFENVIAIAGSHGKTTCSSMCAHALKYIGVPFTAHIGGFDSELGNFYSSGSDYFLTEACEYKKNLLKLSPTTGVVLNIDKDHMECYKTEEDLFETFKAFSKKAKTVFVCADNEKCLKLGDYSNFGILNTCADYRATELKSNDEKYSFTIEEYGKKVGKIKLQAIGKSNIYNALAAFAILRSYGFNEREIIKGLENFTAVKRRFERIGSYNGALMICDYAHHPNEIISTLATALRIQKGRLFVVFQPHTYSRTKILFKDFVEALKPIKNLIIYKTYSAREEYDEEGSAERLANELGCLYSENVYSLKVWLKASVKEGDTVLFLGAGDIYYVAQLLLKGFTI